MATAQHKEKFVFEPIEKVVVNAGVGKLRNLSQFDEKVLPEVVRDLAAITGQHPRTRPAKKSIAGFKIREGDVVGLQITLRHARMRDFLLKLFNIVLPRVKDFRGLEESSVDEHGNLNIGFREHYVFPEIEAEKSRTSFGLQVTVVPKNRSRAKAIAFYTQVGVPFKGLKSKK